MYNLLYRYLIVNKKLSIPGLGQFMVQETPAALDFVKGVLRAPQTFIGFSNANNGKLDNNLLHFLKRELKQDEIEVVRKLESFTSSIKHSIEEPMGVELPGIGKLKKQSTHGSEILFMPQPTPLPSNAFNDIKLSNSNSTKANLVELYTVGDNLILTEETEEDKLEMIIKEKQEDFWWVYALIFALMATGATLWYYI